MKTFIKFNLPSLNGFRAFAVLIVFLSHAGLGKIIPGGFGVTVFFFLSGYLITTLLRIEYEENNKINLKSFYLRRIYRILPPMYIILFTILILSKFGVVENSASAKGVIAQVLQATNYYMINVGQGIVPNTGVFWSLAVEEHFYLAFPILFSVCVSRWNYHDIAKIFLLICLLELFWRCVLVFCLHATLDRTYLSTDTRFDSLLFGCIMGIWMNPAFENEIGNLLSIGSKMTLLIISGILVIFTLIYRNESFRETARYTIQGIGLFPLFWLAIRYYNWGLFKILNLKPIAFFGTISYSFYLSHFFWLFIVGRYIKNPIIIGLVGFLLTIVFSLLMYYLVELPFARLRKRLHVYPSSPKSLLLVR